MFFISDAYAQAAGGGMTELAVQIVPLLLIFVVFWFFLIRPQQKRQKEHIKLCQSLGKGDEILTLGGLAGRIVSLDDSYIVIEISRVDDKPVTITMQRGSVQTVLPRGTIKYLRDILSSERARKKLPRCFRVPLARFFWGFS